MKILIASLLLLGLLSCKKDAATAADNTPPVITIATPSGGQVFTAGQTIAITGTITDDNYIAEVHVHVSNQVTGALLMDVHLYPAAASTSFNQSLTATAGVQYRIQVIAKDKAVNQATETRDATCN